MKYVADIRTSESSLLKSEIRVLRTLVVVLVALLIYGEWRLQKVKDSITPQAIYEACNKEITNVGK